MTQISRRTFSKQTFLFSLLTAMSFPGTAMAFLDKFKTDKFLSRDDLADAVKSLYMTYDAFNHYPHKFNDVVSKTQLRSLQFHINNGLEKEYVEHYMSTMEPLLQRIKKAVEDEGPDKGLFSMFEGTTCSYQLMEHINVSDGQRSFPCPYNVPIRTCLDTAKNYWALFPWN